MKKLFAVAVALAISSFAAVFADVTLKKLDNGKVEVTFLFPYTSPKNVLLAGDFTDWQSGAKTMKKTDKGFVFTRTVSPKTKMTYKFIVDGSWTSDRNAPDKVDDGFGGNNGFIDVAALIEN
jgi:1,4-alpha-glucan branching enzyme